MSIKSIAVEAQKFSPENSFALTSSNVSSWELTFLQMFTKLKTLRESTDSSVYTQSSQHSFDRDNFTARN